MNFRDRGDGMEKKNATPLPQPLATDSESHLVLTLPVAAIATVELEEALEPYRVARKSPGYTVL